MFRGRNANTGSDEPLIHEPGDQNIEERVLLLLKTYLGVGRSVPDASETFIVHVDMQRSRRADLRVDEVGRGNWVEQGGCGSVCCPRPLCCEHLERVRERRTDRGQQRALGLIELQLR